MPSKGFESRRSDLDVVDDRASVRDRLDIRPGDKLRWTATEAGELCVEVVKQRYGAFDDFEAVPMGDVTDEEIDFPGPEAPLERFIEELPDDIAP